MSLSIYAQPLQQQLTARKCCALNKTSEAENTDVCRDVLVLCLQKTCKCWACAELLSCLGHYAGSGFKNQKKRLVS